MPNWSEGSEERGRPTTARPFVGAVGCGQGPCKGGRTRPARKGQRLPTASLQRGSTYRGVACGHDTHPPTRCLPRAAVANSAHYCRLRRGSGDSG
ncbi:hypothetical protein B296_00051849 [Ensete ventricosum]|uniref:Uncharacterized protein n=1 Tax=Ensete ventricosum TaxID=4639 RepID=A0A426YF67_ENSVE|nr:hypothetical protein B296_00051849 [Ensete ventricosum]